MIVDDGSTDRTVAVAEELGVQHIFRLGRHLGLARAFERGIHSALRLGADIIVNTDADNQYCAEDIANIVAPILANRADIVIGARATDEIPHFSFTKRVLQKTGSWVVRKVSRANVMDAPSGFRALSREACLSLHIFSRYSYTIETIIEARLNNFRILSVPVRTMPDLRPSRLASGIPQYIFRSAETLFRVFVIYYAFRFFLVLSSINLALGLALGIRFLYFMSLHKGNGHIQSLQLCVIFCVLSFVLFSLAVLGDLIAVNRKLLEKIDLSMNLSDLKNFKEE